MKYLFFYESIRKMYKEFGVDNYYLNNNSYKNPHYNYIEKIVQYIIDNNIVDLSKCLDMSCGSGEITKILINNNIKNINATDPYLCDLYNQKYNFKCMNYSFKDIVNNKLKINYSTIFCSYALHLADKSMISNISWNLSLISKYLVIITPNNKPNINLGWDKILEFKYKKSKCRIYKSVNK